jgi:hypothetical protein
MGENHPYAALEAATFFESTHTFTCNEVSRLYYHPHKSLTNRATKSIVLISFSRVGDCILSLLNKQACDLYQTHLRTVGIKEKENEDMVWTTERVFLLLHGNG